VRVQIPVVISVEFEPVKDVGEAEVRAAVEAVIEAYEDGRRATCVEAFETIAAGSVLSQLFEALSSRIWNRYPGLKGKVRQLGSSYCYSVTEERMASFRLRSLNLITQREAEERGQY